MATIKTIKPLVPDPMLPLPKSPVIIRPLVPDPMVPLPEPSVPVTISATRKKITYRLNVTQNVTVSTYLRIGFKLNVLPTTTAFDSDVISIDSQMNIVAIDLKLKEAISNLLGQLIDGKIENFFDDDRNLKTVLNLGNDQQSLLTNWTYDPTDSKAILVKLYSPLPDHVRVEDESWISRELSPPIIDQIYIQSVLQEALRLYLRPPNKDVEIPGIQGYSAYDVTLQSLIPSASAASSSIEPIDLVLKKYYTQNLSGADLNVSYDDYNNFVHFGSAYSRLNAFRTKLSMIESLNSKIEEWNVAFTGISGSIISDSQTYGYIQKIADEKTSLVRSFDGYEKFLFYDTEIPYSSSLTGLSEDKLYYHSDATWPKISGSIASVTSSAATGWLTDQSVIANDYDRGNPNYLKNNLPNYLVRDADSQEFISFIDMIGHHFDIIKPYIDEMTQIYNRDNASDSGLSKDLTWNIAQSLGIDLPNEYSIKQLTEYTIGRENSDKIYQEIVAETWKRFIHNQIYINKSKGTKTAIQGLINAYGILPSIIRIRESATPAALFPTESYETFTENSNVLLFENSSSIDIPWSTIPPVKSIEIRFSPTIETSSILLNADNNWSLKIVNSSTGSGYLSLVNDSDQITTVTSSTFPLFDGNFYSVMLRKDTGNIELLVRNSDSYEISGSSTTQETTSTVTSSWQTAPTLYLGGSGSNFRGYVDEFRVWGETISNSTFERHTLYPGLYGGNDPYSAANALYARLSFNTPVDLNTTQSLSNDTPYAATGSLSAFTASAFPLYSTWPYNMGSVSREVLVYSPDSGGTQYSSNKITIAPAPTLRLNSSNLPELSRDQSIVSLSDKQEQTSANNIIGLYFSMTDSINDSIIRSMGSLSLQDILGNPADLYSTKYQELSALNKFYWENYAYTYNPNNFVDFTQNLLGGFFKQIRDMIPARSQLITGLVIESSILERNKIQYHPLNITSPYANAAGSLNYDVAIGERISPDTFGDIQDLNAIIDLPSTEHVVADELNYESIIEISQENEIDCILENIDALISVENTLAPIVDYSNLSALITASDLNFVIDASIPTYSSSISIHSFYTQLVHILGNVTLGDYDSYQITARSDFNEIGSTNYFYRNDGTVKTIQYVKVREYNSVLIDKGNWSITGSYIKNDFVTQDSTISGASPGNGKEFKCINNTQFMSSIPPYLDTVNWSPMKYISQRQILLRKATWQNNKVVLVPTSSAAVAFVGYAPYHYRFTRDTTTATKRNRYVGCKQTILTTTDGNPPVEVFIGAVDRLFVTEGNEPVQIIDNTPGLLLEVK